MCLYLKPAELSAVVQDPDKALLTAVTLSRSAASCSSCCSCVRLSWQGSASPKPVCSQPLPDSFWSTVLTNCQVWALPLSFPTSQAHEATFHWPASRSLQQGTRWSSLASLFRPSGCQLVLRGMSTCWEPECWWQEFLLKTCKFPAQVLLRITSRMCFLACFHNEVSCVCRRKCCSWCHLASNQLLFRVRIILQWFQYILLKQMQL